MAKCLPQSAWDKHPHEMAFSPDGKLLDTTDNGTMRIENPGSGGNSLSIIDVAGRKKIGDISLAIIIGRTESMSIQRAECWR